MTALPVTLDDRPLSRRVGLVTLATDHTTEVDFAVLPPRGIGVYATRIPFANPVTPETLAAMAGDVTQAAALIHPQFAEAGFLDTSVVHLTFDNGAYGVAEASFQAVYGYDVRGEVFGSGGVLLAGKAPAQAGTLNTELFGDAYVAQFAHFAESIRTGRDASVTGVDARVALDIALAARESVETGAPVALAVAALR